MDCVWSIVLTLLIFRCKTFQCNDIHFENEIQEFFGDLDKPIPTKDVVTMLWQTASLPCDISPSIKDDAVHMVLWFKGEQPEPIYSYDIREHTSKNPKVWSSPDVFGKRASFNVTSEPAVLEVRDLRVDDEAIYRCRVDFKNSPTRNVKVNFTVIVAPDRPVIYDFSRKEIETLLEHCNEGSVLSLSCEVTGGRPQPSVFWYLGDKLLDDTYGRNSSNLTVNQLNNLTLTRHHLNSQLICEARNTKLTEALTKLVILKINLKPSKVEILDKEKRQVLSANKEYEIDCKAEGSQPRAQITWILGERRMEHLALKFPNTDNQVISIMKFIPRIEDHGKYITCRAENPAIQNSTIEDKWTLNVQYFPQVTLRMGHNLDPRNIKEGDDVYFECEMRSNPKAYKQEWYLNGEEIHQNVSGGIILTDTSLVLQKVTKHDSGNYTCSVTNVEGKGVSNPVTLQIMFAPSCKVRKEQLYGALKYETVLLKCEVVANPPPSAFYWTFNNSGDSSSVSPSRFNYSGFISVIKYTPHTDMDYGTLACWAQNSVGDQKYPCLYQVVAAARPFSLINCSITNQTEDSLQVQCTENFNGGLPQHFMMELLELSSLESKYNVTVYDKKPVFFVRGIDPVISYAVKLLAINEKGSSEPVYLNTTSSNGAAKYTNFSKSLPITDVMTGLISLISITAVLVFIFGSTIFLYQCRHKYSKHRVPEPQPKNKSEDLQPYMSAVFVRAQPTAKNSKGPDIITNTYNYAEARTEATSNFPMLVNDQTDNSQKEREVNFKITKHDCDFTSTDALFGYRILSKSAKEILPVNMYETSTLRYGYGHSNKQDTFVIQPRYNKLSPEVVTASTRLQESCI